MYLRDALANLSADVTAVATALADQAAAHLGVPMPGRTHMQHAQPVLLSHQLLAHAWPLARDLDRIRDLDKRLAISPYGSAALAGTSLGLDPRPSPQRLGFAGSVANSIDGTSARDLVAEAAWVCAQVGVDISRLAETSSSGAPTSSASSRSTTPGRPGRASCPEEEPRRGRAGTRQGRTPHREPVGPLGDAQGPPTGLQPRPPGGQGAVFDSLDQLAVLLPAVAGMVATLRFHPERLADLAPRGFSLATDVADWLVRQRVPFAHAHEIAGEAVRYCEAGGIELTDLTADQVVEISPQLTPDVLSVLTVAGSIDSRDGRGGTATVRVREQLDELRAALAAD